MGLALARCKSWALLILGALGAALSAYFQGRRDAAAAAKVEALKGYAKTRKDIDDADASLGSDPAVLRDWLRERGKP